MTILAIVSAQFDAAHDSSSSKALTTILSLRIPGAINGAANVVAATMWTQAATFAKTTARHEG